MEIRNQALLFVIISAVLYGTITAGGQFFVNLGFSAYEIAFYRIVFELLILLSIVVFNRKYMVKKEMIPFFIVFGLFNALQEFTQFQAIVLGVPVAVVALLLYSQPVWTVWFGRTILKEKITKRKIIALVAAAFGILIVLRVWDIDSAGPPLGIFFALLGGIFLSLWVIWARKSGIHKQHFITTAFGSIFFTLVWLLVFWPIVVLVIQKPGLVNLSFNFPPVYWIYMLLFALISGVIPQSFFYKGVQIIQASIAGMILLLEPVSASILAAVFFGQFIGLNILLGGSLILLSNYIINKRTANGKQS